VPSLAGITYVHGIDYFEKGIDTQGPFYSVDYHIDSWADSDAFTNALVGLGQSEPHRHPLSTNLVCVSAVPRGIGSIEVNSDGTPAYGGGCVIRAMYRSPGIAFGGSFSNVYYDDPGLVHQIDPGTPLTWCTQEIDYDIEVIAVPNAIMYYESDGAESDIQLTVDVPVTTMVLTFHRRNSLPMSLARSLRGHINQGVFLGCEEGTVHFVGAKTSRTFATDGSVEQRIQLVFRNRREHWNKVIRAGKMPTNPYGWEFVRDSDGYRKLYLADLSPLLGI
jgi:hypothetical protein